MANSNPKRNKETGKKFYLIRYVILVAGLFLATLGIAIQYTGWGRTYLDVIAFVVMILVVIYWIFVPRMTKPPKTLGQKRSPFNRVPICNTFSRVARE